MKDLSVMSHKEANDSIVSEFVKMGEQASGFGETSVVKDGVKFTLVNKSALYLDWEGEKTIAGTRDNFDYKSFVEGCLAIHKADAGRSKVKITTWSLEKKDDSLLTTDDPSMLNMLSNIERVEEKREDGINVKYTYVSDGCEVRCQGQRILIKKGVYHWEKFHAFSDWGDSRNGGHFG